MTQEQKVCIVDNAQQIFKMLEARTAVGSNAFLYGDILKCFGIPDTEGNRRFISDFARANGYRRRKPFLRSNKGVEPQPKPELTHTAIREEELRATLRIIGQILSNI